MGSKEAPRWQLAASYGQFWSHLQFDDGMEPTLNQQTVVGSAGRLFTRGGGLFVSGGAILGGSVEGGGEEYDVHPGWLASVRYETPLVRERGAIPFLQFSVALSLSKTKIEDTEEHEVDFMAFDVRIGCALGYTFFQIWQLYLAPRVFAGPVFWDKPEGQTQGRDRYFFEAGLGTTVLLPGGDCPLRIWLSTG